MKRGKTFLILEILSPAAAFLLALVMGAVIILFMAENPLHIYRVMFRGGLGSIDAFGYVLFSATPLILTGLAVAFAFRRLGWLYPAGHAPGHHGAYLYSGRRPGGSPLGVCAGHFKGTVRRA
jgi:hypothetical protein